MRSVLLDIPTNHYFSEVNALEAFFELLWGLLMFFVMLMLIAAVVLYIIFSISKYGMFRKAGKPGWAALIPFYNNYTLFSMLYGNGWWFLACLIPFVGIVVSIISVIDLAKAFGKSGGFAAGLIFLSVIFYPMLAFGSARYQGVLKTGPFSGPASQRPTSTVSQSKPASEMTKEEMKEAVRRKMEARQNGQSPFEH